MGLFNCDCGTTDGVHDSWCDMNPKNLMINRIAELEDELEEIKKENKSLKKKLEKFTK